MPVDWDALIYYVAVNQVSIDSQSTLNYARWACANFGVANVLKSSSNFSPNLETLVICDPPRSVGGSPWIGGFMEREEPLHSQADAQALGMELFLQAEHYALADLHQQAEAILGRIWSLQPGGSPNLRDAVAWNMGWLRLRTGDYRAAEEWFSRMAAPPMLPSRLWPAQRQMLLQICRAFGQLPSAAPAALEPSAPALVPLHSATPIPLLSVISLGRFQICRGHAALPTCRARKPIAVLRYLLLSHQRTAHREELMEAVWPDSGPREAAHSLHVAVSMLRRYLDPSANHYLSYAAGQYALNPQVFAEDDARAFLRLCGAGDSCWQNGDLERARVAYLEALSVYAGDYYVDAQDLPWALAERERLLARYLTALDRMGAIWARQGRHELAVDCYQRLLDRDGFREDIHCQLIRCYLRLGQRGLALRQYEHCAALLIDELGMEPMDETQELYRYIREALEVGA
jgi:DNA-binding SARP family transcriptional activator